MCIGYRVSVLDDIPLLAEMNHALIRDEGSENPMDTAQLAARMASFLAGEYRALLLTLDGDIMGYCLYRTEVPELPVMDSAIHVRQYYILPPFRRRGLGKHAFMMLLDTVFAGAGKITLDVLEANPIGRAFWESLGFTPFSHHMRHKSH